MSAHGCAPPLLVGQLEVDRPFVRLFLIGVVIFALASAACGAAVAPAMLVSSRFAQGMGQAVAGGRPAADHGGPHRRRTHGVVREL